MSAPEVRALVDGGKLLARLGARAEAEAVLRAALAIDRDARDALLWLGAIVADATESLELIGRAYTIDPADPRARAGLAWARDRLDADASSDRPCEAARRQPEEATPQSAPWTLATDASPAQCPTPADMAAARVRTVLDQARAALDAGDLTGAILAADEAARLDPRSLDALALLGVAYYREARPLDAERVYRRMLAIQPDHAEAHANLGLLFAEAGRGEEAERAYRRALDIDPSLDEVRLALADLLVERGSIDAAVAEWRAAADRHPAILEFQVKIAEAYESVQRFDEAAAAYSRVIDRHGDDPSLRLRLGRVLHASGRSGAAIEQFREACRGPLATAECFVELAAALLDVGRHDEAMDALDRALVLAPDDPAARELLARVQPPSRQAAARAVRPRSLESGPQVIGPARGILDRFRLP